MYSVHGGRYFKKSEDAHYGLKPMNCPGHCILYMSKKRSFRELPIRYADFSPLHRNEVSGSLSGLTRLRGFHQDDGHTFCAPEQVQDEVLSSLEFIDMVYTILGFDQYKLILSTRPKEHFLGKAHDWDTAETQLKDALKVGRRPWVYESCEGSFYRPKIDILLTDKDGRDH